MQKGDYFLQNISQDFLNYTQRKRKTMSEHVKSFIVKHGNEKVQIAHKSPENFMERCKRNFGIDDNTTLMFKRPDSEISVDIETIEILPNESELHLTPRSSNIKSDSSDAEEEQVIHCHNNQEDLKDTVAETFEVGGRGDNQEDLNDTETFEVGGRGCKQDRNKFLNLIYWRNAPQSFLVLDGILALLYYVSENNATTAIFHITLLFIIMALSMRFFFIITKIKRMDTSNLRESAQLYGETLRHVWHTILVNIELGVKSVCVTLHQAIFSDDIKEIFVFQICFGLILTAYVLSFFRLTTSLTIVTLTVFILPRIYENNQSKFERIARIFKRLSRKLRNQPDEHHEE